jgi:hypothetical protein
MTQNQGSEGKPDESQVPSLGQPTEETTGTTSAWPEWLTGKQPGVVGTSYQPPQQEDRVLIPSSPRKKPTTEIVLPRIPEGVQVEPQLLGHVGKLKYSDHDVSDETKYPKLASRVFMQNIVVNQLGEMISQPHQWAVGLDRTSILGLLKLPHFGRGQYATTCIKQLLAVMHGGDIWLDRPVPITVELITQITGLPSRGMDPALILDDKSKEKALAEEMKKKYGTARGTRGIIIKWINNAVTQLGANILACKLLRKCRKDEVPAGVIAVAAQCAEGTFVSWVPYLLNLFQVDCKDAQDLGTKFHYSWLLTLIAFMGWWEPEYVVFATRPQPAGARYLLLRSGPQARHKRENGIIFEAYLWDIQEAISRSWRITPEVVARYGDIANFWATRQAMWIQPRQDPDKQWLPMRYCITEGDIDMVINEWPDAWRIPSIPREVLEGPAEGEAEQAETQPPQNPVPKKPRMGQNKPTQENEGAKPIRTQKGQKETNEQPKQAKGVQETAPNPNTQEPGGTKRPVVQAAGVHKKSKVQRASPDYTITEDDGEMIARMVQDCLAEDFDHATHHRDKLQKELAEMGQLLRTLGEAQRESSSRGIESSTTQTNERVEVEERDPTLPMPHAHATVYIKRACYEWMK